MTSVKIIVTAFIAFLFGAIFSAFAMNTAAPNMMIKEVASPYDFEKTVRVIEDRINAREGWHVITTYDENAEVTAHGGDPIGKMAVIKYCNGKFASRMLAADERKKISVMLPKTISVYEDSMGRVHIAMSNGKMMGKLFGGEIEAIVEEVSREVEAIMAFMHFKFSLF
jgi:uncharacterized protein (DUF302 family)